MDAQKTDLLIPPTLIVAAFGIGFESGCNRPVIIYDVRTIGDTSSISGGCPSFHNLSYTLFTTGLQSTLAPQALLQLEFLNRL